MSIPAATTGATRAQSVLLVSPPAGRSQLGKVPMPPLGLAWLAAVLEADGQVVVVHEVVVDVVVGARVAEAEGPIVVVDQVAVNVDADDLLLEVEGPGRAQDAAVAPAADRAVADGEVVVAGPVDLRVPLVLREDRPGRIALAVVVGQFNVHVAILEDDIAPCSRVARALPQVSRGMVDIAPAERLPEARLAVRAVGVRVVGWVGQVGGGSDRVVDLAILDQQVVAVDAEQVVGLAAHLAAAEGLEGPAGVEADQAVGVAVVAVEDDVF